MLARQTDDYMELDEAIGLRAASLHVDRWPALVDGIHEWKVLDQPRPEFLDAWVHEGSYEFWCAVQRKALRLFYLCPLTYWFRTVEPTFIRRVHSNYAAIARKRGAPAVADWLKGRGRFSIERLRVVREEASQRELTLQPVSLFCDDLYVSQLDFDAWMRFRYMEMSYQQWVIGECDETKLKALGWGDVSAAWRQHPLQQPARTNSAAGLWPYKSEEATGPSEQTRAKREGKVEPNAVSRSYRPQKPLYRLCWPLVEENPSIDHDTLIGELVSQGVIATPNALQTSDGESIDMDTFKRNLHNLRVHALQSRGGRK